MKRHFYTINDSHFRSFLRLITFRNPTPEHLTFQCRTIRAPAWGSWGGQPTPPSPPTNEMNLLVLDDGHGEILAAGEQRISETNLAPCGFVPDEEQPGQRVAEVSVPEEISRLGLSEIFENFVVDMGADQPTLKRKPD